MRLTGLVTEEVFSRQVGALGQGSSEEADPKEPQEVILGFSSPS